jgi:hypothetical protein
MVVPNVVLFREIPPHDSAPICRPLPWSSQNPAGATSGPRSTWEEVATVNAFLTVGLSLVRKNPQSGNH